ncbi:hypothetical protein RN001_006009 [Aquatica leii]|uniref:Uncharacterized protein n=1 Tax=Aquatica leii TaxID=1421715 RepID=A0AAN7SS62_9COLE|nr:hypothetical protein RN001_006009 [Aquatica leii]
MATININVNGSEDLTIVLQDEEFLQTIYDDSSILINVAQQFVQYNVETVEFLGVVGPIKSNISDEVAQPSPQPREDLNESEEKKIWTDANVGMLIELYKKYEDEFKSGIKKTIWNRVTKSLCKVVEVSITWVQCDTKWKGKNSIVLRQDSLYRNDVGQAKGVCKRGKKIEIMKPKELTVGVPLKPDRIKSIKSLFNTHYGEEYKENPDLDYFIKLFECNSDNVADDVLGQHSESEDDEDITI